MLAAASGDDIPSRIVKGITSLFTGGNSIARALAVLMIIICGVAFMSGRSGAAWAKASIGRVVLGLSCVILASAFVSWIISIVS